jgi:hypothetical protein
MRQSLKVNLIITMLLPILILVLVIMSAPVLAWKIEGPDPTGNTGLRLVYNQMPEDSDENELETLFQMNISSGLYDEQSGFYSDLSLKQPLHSDERTELLIKQAYFNWDVNDKNYIIAGKKRFSRGFSYFWIPAGSALFRKCDFQPEEYEPGILQIIWGLTPNEFVSSQIILSLGDSAKNDPTLANLHQGLWVDLYVSDIELYLAGFSSKNHEDSLGLGLRKCISETTIHLEGTVIYNNKRKYFDDLNNNEVRYSNKTGGKPIIAIGMNRQVGENGFLLLEYFHDGTGYSEKEWDNYLNHLQFLEEKVNTSEENTYYLSALTELLQSFNPCLMRQNYSFLSYSHRLNGLGSLEGRCLISIDDKSGFFQTFISWEAAPNFFLELETLHFFGNANTEFILLPIDHSVNLSIKKYF